MRKTCSGLMAGTVMMRRKIYYCWVPFREIELYNIFTLFCEEMVCSLLVNLDVFSLLQRMDALPLLSESG